MLQNVERALSGKSFDSVVRVTGTSFRSRYDPLRGAGSEVGGAVGLAVEDSKRSRTAECLRLRERAMMAARSEGIVITDPILPDDPIVFVNPAFEAMTGFPAEEAMCRTCRFLQGAERVQPQLRVLRRALREERACQVVLRNYKKDGAAFWNGLSVSPVFGRDGASSTS